MRLSTFKQKKLHVTGPTSFAPAPSWKEVKQLVYVEFAYERFLITYLHKVYNQPRIGIEQD